MTCFLMMTWMAIYSQFHREDYERLIEFLQDYNPPAILQSDSLLCRTSYRTNQTKKVRIVDFGDTLAEILPNARKEQLKKPNAVRRTLPQKLLQRSKKTKTEFTMSSIIWTEQRMFQKIIRGNILCLLKTGWKFGTAKTLGIVCRKIAQKLDGFEGFHFHQLRHHPPHTSNLLATGAAPKDVQELLGHSDASANTTMNVYAHSTRKAKRESARLHLYEITI